ncbi:Xaa-Pro peptidase family protein [Aminivibrio sp.]
MEENVRVSKTAALLKAHDIDALLVATSPDLEYLTGLNPIDDERFKGICIFPDGRFFAIAPSLCGDEFREDLGESAAIYLWKDTEGPGKAFDAALGAFGVPRKLGVNDAVRAASVIEIVGKHGIELFDGRKITATVRMDKSQEEVDRLLKVGALADEVLTRLSSWIEPGMSERDVQLKLRDVYESIGGEKISYVVGSGPNSALPHYNKSARIIEKKDIVLIDFGGRHQGYRSDTTRTFFVGTPSEEQKKIYSIVLEAHLAGEAAVAEGVRACDIDNAVRSVIERAGYGEYFTHRTGHGIGIVAHEAPDISATDTTVLKKGMAFSIEPGIYLPGKFGIRIENCVAVTENGALPFTRFPRELTVL